MDTSHQDQKEKIVTFGRDDGMMGILTEPASRKAPGRPWVILLNAGIVHRVGPYRSSVELARRMAAQGFAVLRFDLSGLGDSEMRKDTRSDEERAAADIREAMDMLQASHGASRFILLGLCSGADNAHPVTVADARVVGGVFLDGFGYETPGFYLHHYLARVQDPTRWANLARRFWAALKSMLQLPRQGLGAGQAGAPRKTKTYVREFPPRERVEKEVQGLVDRGVELLYIYTSGVARYLNHKGQFHAMFPKLRWKPNLQLEYYPQADHTYTLLSDREWLYRTILTWMRRFN